MYDFDSFDSVVKPQSGMPVPPNKKGKYDFSSFDNTVKKKEVGGEDLKVGGQVGTSVPQLPKDNFRLATEDEWMSRDPLAEAEQHATAIRGQQKSFEDFTKASKKAKDINRVVSTNGAVGSKFVSNVIGDNADNFSIEQLKEKTKGNQTAQAAISGIADKRKVEDAVLKSSDPYDAAVKYYGIENPTEVERGDAIRGLLNNPNYVELSKSSPELSKQYKEARFNWMNDFPAAAQKDISQKIGQYLEDKGLTNSFYNNPGKEKVDEAVDELVKSGDMDEHEAAIYRDKIRPDLGSFMSYVRGSKIPTADVINTFSRSLVKNGGDIMEGARDAIDKVTMGAISTLGEGRQAHQQRILENQQEVPTVTPSGEGKQFGMEMTDMIGFAVPSVLGTLAGVPAAATMATQFYGANRKHGMELFRDNPNLQDGYATLTTAIDMIAGEGLPFKGAGDTIKGLITDVADKKITAKAAKEKFLNFFSDLTQHTASGTAAIEAMNIGHNAAESVFGGKNFDADEAAINAFNQLPKDALAMAFFGGVAASKNLKGKPKEEVGGNVPLPSQYETGIASEPKQELSPEQKVIQQAIDNGELKGTNMDMAKAAVQSPEMAKQFVDEISAQVNNKVASDLGSPIEGAKKTYGETLVNHVKEEPKKESGVSVILPEENKKPDIVPLKKETEDVLQEPPTIKPPKENVVVGGEGETVGITHKQMDDVAKEFGWATYEKDPETVAGWDATAQERIDKDPQAISKMLNRMRDGKIDDPVDQRMMIKYVSSLKARINEKPTKELLDELRRAKDISNIGGRMLGKSLVARKGEVGVEDTLADHLVDRSMDKGHDLSEAQIKIETEKYNELKKEKEKLQNALEEERAQYSRMLAEYGVNQARAMAKKASKKSHEDYAAERRTIIEEAKNKVKEARERAKGINKMGIGGRTKIDDLITIAPEVKKFMQSLADEGYDKLDNFVTAIHAGFKDVVDGLTKGQVIEIIGGIHDERGKTKAQKANELRLVQREAKLLSELNDARKGVEKEKSESKKSEKNRRIVELEKKIKEVREINKEKLEESPFELSKEESETLDANNKRQKALEKRAAKLEEDIKNKKYEPEKRQEKPFRKSYRTQQLEDKVINLEKKLAEDRYKDQRAKRGKWEKGYDKFQEIVGARRLIQTAIDWSVLLRQLVTQAFNPRKWGVFAKEVNAARVSTFSQKNFDRLMNAIHKHEDFKNMVDDGIRFNEFETREVGKQNELYPKSWVLNVPLVKDMILASQRAADSALNTARFELYQRYKKNLIDDGVTRESDPKVYEQMAKWVMNNTGSGNLLKAFEDNVNAQKFLGNTFYGARLMAANFNFLNPAYYIKMPKELRAQIWKDIAFYTGTTMATGAGLMAAGGKVSFDPDDSDFLMARFGDKVYDITGGKAAYIRTALRILEAGRDRFQTMTGNKTKHEANESLKFAGESTLRFFRNKLAPNTSYGIDAFTGHNSIGQDFNPIDILKLYPMYWDDAVKGFKDDGFISLATVLAPNILGVGYNSYYSDANKSTLQELIQRNTRSDEMNKDTIKNFKEGGREITNEEFEKFTEERDKEITNNLVKFYTGSQSIYGKPFTELSKEQIVKETSYIKSKATEKVKEDLFGKAQKTREGKKEQTKLQKERQKLYK